MLGVLPEREKEDGDQGRGEQSTPSDPRRKAPVPRSSGKPEGFATRRRQRAGCARFDV